MRINDDGCRGRSLLWVGSVLLFGAAVLLAVGVIPAIKAFAVLGGQLEYVLALCWTSVEISCAAAITMCFVAAGAKNLRRDVGITLGSVMLVCVILFFALTDAAFAFHGRSAAAKTAAVLLHLCSAVYFAVPVLIVGAVNLIPKGVIRSTTGVSAAAAASD